MDGVKFIMVIFTIDKIGALMPSKKKNFYP